jgi:hypothetical protein
MIWACQWMLGDLQNVCDGNDSCSRERRYQTFCLLNGPQKQALGTVKEHGWHAPSHLAFGDVHVDWHNSLLEGAASEMISRRCRLHCKAGQGE